MKTVLITGAKGQLGLEVTRQLAEQGEYKVIPVDIDEVDITIMDQVWQLMKHARPDMVINCAAYTAVDQCESEEDTAFRVNAIGPKNLAIAAFELGASILHISTDYVFDGQGIRQKDGTLRPYREYDDPRPQTIYGKTKLEGERMVVHHNPRHFIIRTAWLYGEGNNFVRTMLNLASTHDTIRVVDDQMGSPTSTSELARMICYLMHTPSYGLYHGTCEDCCTWYTFAKEIFRIMDLSVKVVPVTSEEYKRPAKRPAYSVLDNYLLNQTTDFRFKTWQEAIVNYLRETHG